MMQQLSEQLIFLLFITVGMLVSPLVFIALDYWAGIRKARKRGDTQNHLIKMIRNGCTVSMLYRKVLNER